LHRFPPDAADSGRNGPRPSHEKGGAVEEQLRTDQPEIGWQSDRPLLALDDALTRLTSEDELKAQLIEMRYFGGMTAEESSEALSISVHVVRRHLRLAQAWLRKEMAGSGM
jgi:RNA polymerase sigma-70 factor, ECF subfamily